MGAGFYLSITVCVLALALSVVLLALWLRDRRRLRRLTEQTQLFLQEGAHIPLSTADDAFAALQNAICDMENQLLLARSHVAEEAKKNADFISDISHQLKTPLAGIRLYCEMMRSDAKNPYVEKELELIEKMERLIAGLLRLEKLLADAYVMQFASCEIAEPVRLVVSELGHLFPEKQFQVNCSGSMRCDKAWLGEAIGNIVKNACEHTAPNGVIRIDADTGERSVTLTVEDDGGGVPQEDLPRLFTRFHRTANAAPDSTGIGMAITKTIVEKHHGTITAENGAKGLKITMCFPVLDENLKI